MYASIYVMSQIHRESRMVVWAKGEGNRAFVFNGDRVSVWEDENILEVDSGDGCTTV